MSIRKHLIELAPTVLLMAAAYAVQFGYSFLYGRGWSIMGLIGLTVAVWVACGIFNVFRFKTFDPSRRQSLGCELPPPLYETRFDLVKDKLPQFLMGPLLLMFFGGAWLLNKVGLLR